MQPITKSICTLFVWMLLNTLFCIAKHCFKSKPCAFFTFTHNLSVDTKPVYFIFSPFHAPHAHFY
nr:MAG TPA: hypothetical protein [Caudoviricetes sp.]